MARSNLVQVKKNKTMQWLHDLPDEEQLKVIDLAVEKRRSVRKEYKDEKELRERRQNMVLANARGEALKRKTQKEKDGLSQLHLIRTSQELLQALEEIDTQSVSATKKRAQKLSLLKTQIKISKKF